MVPASDMAMAASLVGLGAAAFVARPVDREAPQAERGAAGPAASPALLSAGEPYFEAVAAALRAKGYLRS